MCSKEDADKDAQKGQTGSVSSISCRTVCINIELFDEVLFVEKLVYCIFSKDESRL